MANRWAESSLNYLRDTVRLYRDAAAFPPIVITGEMGPEEEQVARELLKRYGLDQEDATPGE